MKKLVFAALFAVMLVGFVACTNETVEETVELQSPDKDCGSSPGDKGCDN